MSWRDHGDFFQRYARFRELGDFFGDPSEFTNLAGKIRPQNLHFSPREIALRRDILFDFDRQILGEPTRDRFGDIFWRIKNITVRAVVFCQVNHANIFGRKSSIKINHIRLACALKRHNRLIVVANRQHIWLAFVGWVVGHQFNYASLRLVGILIFVQKQKLVFFL